MERNGHLKNKPSSKRPASTYTACIAPSIHHEVMVVGRLGGTAMVAVRGWRMITRLGGRALRARRRMAMEHQPSRKHGASTSPMYDAPPRTTYHMLKMFWRLACQRAAMTATCRLAERCVVCVRQTGGEWGRRRQTANQAASAALHLHNMYLTSTHNISSQVGCCLLFISDSPDGLAGLL